MKYYDQKQVGRKRLFGLHFHIIVYHWRKFRQEHKQGMKVEEAATDAEAI